ncbi:hypothetical protein [Tunturiibacter lichenicola]|uniref:hypothetical protein n=1 Tax=Tunturiibacter lichenicola TaxID=2051959 RepID=UPI003D9BFDA1
MKELNATGESKKWHASWIAAVLSVPVAAGSIRWATLGMRTSFCVLLLSFSLAIGLLWIVTRWQKHFIAKILISILLAICTGVALQWVYLYERPNLYSEIHSIAIPASPDGTFLLNIRVSVRNLGRVPGYIERVSLVLTIDASSSIGKQIDAQTLPLGAAKEPELNNQKFTTGEPVSGWLFFSFPGMSHSSIARYFECDSPLLDTVSLRLSAWESGSDRVFSDFKKLKDLGKDACIPPNPTGSSSTKQKETK